jgi:hypothetical protein
VSDSVDNDRSSYATRLYRSLTRWDRNLQWGKWPRKPFWATWLFVFYAALIFVRISGIVSIAIVLAGLWYTRQLRKFGNVPYAYETHDRLTKSQAVYHRSARAFSIRNDAS